MSPDENSLKKAKKSTCFLNNFDCDAQHVKRTQKATQPVELTLENVGAETPAELGGVRYRRAKLSSSDASHPALLRSVFERV